MHISISAAANVVLKKIMVGTVSRKGSSSDISVVKRHYAGNSRERVTPVPISNTEVKSLFADGTSHASGRESRALPA